MKLELIPVSHETKVPVVQNGQAQMSIAPLSVTPPRQKVVDFVVYSNSSICMFGKADNPKLAGVKTVDDLNREEISIAYFTGAAEESGFPSASRRLNLAAYLDRVLLHRLRRSWQVGLTSRQSIRFPG